MISNKNFGTMKTKVGNAVQDTSSNFKTLVGQYLNDRYRQVLQRSNHIQTSTVDYQIAATGGVEDIVLPVDFKDMVKLLDKTNKRTLSQLDLQEWMVKFKDSIDTAGLCENYTIFEDVVREQPTAASVITVVSTSAADTTQTVQIRGVVGNAETYESITLTGTTNASGSKQFTKIYSIGKDDTAGTITVTATAQTLAYLSPEQVQSRIKKLRLGRIPTQSMTLEAIYTVAHLPMANDYDYPVLDCEDVIEAGATADAWRYKRQQAKADYHESLFEKKLDDWMWDRANKPDYVATFKPVPYSREV